MRYNKSTALEVLFVILILVILFSFFVSIIANPSAPREKARRINCAANLKQIGLSLLLYANDHDYQLAVASPNAYQKLMDIKLKTSDHQKHLIDSSYAQDGHVFGCPSNANHATSYKVTDFYYHAGLSTEMPEPDKIIMSGDNPLNHKGEYLNKLYLDGNVEMINLK